MRTLTVLKILASVFAAKLRFVELFGNGAKRFVIVLTEVAFFIECAGSTLQWFVVNKKLSCGAIRFVARCVMAISCRASCLTWLFQLSSLQSCMG